MKAIEFHPGARADYDESLDWYATRAASAARKFAEAVDKSLRHIQRNPEQFHAVDALHRECTLRRFPFRIIFRVTNDQIVVVAVAHAKRRPRYWRDRDSE